MVPADPLERGVAALDEGAFCGAAACVGSAWGEGGAWGAASCVASVGGEVVSWGAAAWGEVLP